MKCIKCHREISDDSKFCTFCGAKIPSNYENEIKSPDGKSKTEEQGKKNSILIYIIIFILLTVFAIAIGVIAAIGVKKISSGHNDSVNTYDQRNMTEYESTSLDTEKAAESENEVINTEAVLLSEKPMFDESKYQKVIVKSADASSTIDQDDFDNDAMVMFDDLDETSWQEGVDGLGIGEYTQAYFDGTYDIKYICFKLGNWRTEDMFVSNAIPSELLITMEEFADSVSFEKMENEPIEQWVEMTEPVTTESFKVTIENVWAGKEYEDTCIAEIILYGEKHQ